MGIVRQDLGGPTSVCVTEKPRELLYVWCFAPFVKAFFFHRVASVCCYRTLLVRGPRGPYQVRQRRSSASLRPPSTRPTPPAYRYRSTWMSIILHSAQSVFFAFLVLGVVLGLA